MGVTVKSTKVDRMAERAIARHAQPVPEKVAEAITWGADEHVLIGLAVGWWLLSRRAPAPQRRASDHVLLTTMAASLLPHLLKTVFNQKRPDRCTVEGHLRGVPLSGKALDAFPSGHAIHVGALASASAELPPPQRNAAWSLGAIVVATRIVLLAHWVSDVAAGLVIGAALERTMRLFTGFGWRHRATFQQDS
jgi:membrane-associated phospholipid phosphatase